MIRPDWWDEATCLGMGPNLFFSPSFPDVESTAKRIKREASAKVVCAKCPVKAPCIQEALKYNDDGVRGGLTAAERRRLTVEIPFQRPARANAEWRVVVNRPNLTNTCEVRLEQNVQNRDHYRVVRQDTVIATYADEMEAWIGLHNATN